MRDIDLLETVLEYGGPEVVWDVPEHATIRPGTGPNIYDGLVISHWSTDA